MFAFISSIIGSTAFGWIKDIIGIVVQVLVAIVQFVFSVIQFLFANFKGVMVFISVLAVIAFIGYYFAEYWGSTAPMTLPFGWEW